MSGRLFLVRKLPLPSRERLASRDYRIEIKAVRKVVSLYYVCKYLLVAQGNSLQAQLQGLLLNDVEETGKGVRSCILWCGI